VSSVQAPAKTQLIEPKDGIDVPQVDGVEWGIANINADDVWALGVKGKKVVVANIDTGVQYNHPALVKQYRGKKKKGMFNHNYNWKDTSGSAQAPFDNNGHGTHTMGTMVGDDHGANQIGVAPKAKWIAANGCNTCSESDLIEAGQWILAPTKLDGTKPKTKKRPNIVNNSWGYQSPGQQPLFDEIIADWDASGIFGTWSNGNIGPGCSSSGSPGSRPQSYSAGAYDVNNTIAGFSSRGPGSGADIKPNISAPGVNVRSSIPGSGYGSKSGTSMAAPHLAGAIALLWSAVPSLKGDIAGTKALLDDTATDKSDLQCGGTADDNNVYGEGRLDALTLIQDARAAARPAGALTLSSN
jgi:subtilisin family serine protease